MGSTPACHRPPPFGHHLPPTRARFCTVSRHAYRVDDPHEALVVRHIARDLERLERRVIAPLEDHRFERGAHGDRSREELEDGGWEIGVVAVAPERTIRRGLRALVEPSR